MDAQWFEHLRAATAMEPPRDGADDGRAHGSPWTLQMVKAIIKCSGEMQNDLCEKRLVGNLLEQYDTPLIRKPGFSTTDGCWWFDAIEGDVRSVVPHAGKNVYLSKPHPAGDPVMPPLTRKGCWSSAPPSLTTRPPWSARCNMLDAARRQHRARLHHGGPGGVGQSLSTCLIANLFGGSHGFMDMNVLYRGRASKARRPLHGQGKHLGSHIFTTWGMKTLVVLFLFGRIGPTVCSSGRHHRPGRPQHRQTAPRRPSQEGDERGPGGCPSPMGRRWSHFRSGRGSG